REERPVTVGAVVEPVAVRLRRLDLASPEPADGLERSVLYRRGAVPDEAVRRGARAILDDIRTRGVVAVVDAAARYGGALADGRLRVERSELRAARDRLDPATRRALDQPIENVTTFAA